MSALKMQVTPYLLVDTLRDWLVIQVTHSDGVNVFRAQTRDNAYGQYEAIKASKFYHMLAFISPDGACIESEYAPVFAHIPRPAFSPTPNADAIMAIKTNDKLIGGFINTPIEAFEKKPAPVIPAGFVTGALPSGFKSGK